MWIPQDFNRRRYSLYSFTTSLHISFRHQNFIATRQNSLLQDTVIPPYSLCCQKLPNSQYTTATGLEHGLVDHITWVLLTIDLVIWARVHFCCQNRTQPEGAWEQIVCTSVCLCLLCVKDFSCYLDLCTVITTKHLNPK